MEFFRVGLPMQYDTTMQTYSYESKEEHTLSVHDNSTSFDYQITDSCVRQLPRSYGAVTPGTQQSSVTLHRGHALSLPQALGHRLYERQ